MIKKFFFFQVTMPPRPEQPTSSGTVSENTANTPVASTTGLPDDGGILTLAQGFCWADDVEPMEAEPIPESDNAPQLFSEDTMSFDCSEVIAQLNQEIESPLKTQPGECDAAIVDGVIAASGFSFLQISVFPASSISTGL